MVRSSDHSESGGWPPEQAPGERRRRILPHGLYFSRGLQVRCGGSEESCN